MKAKDGIFKGDVLICINMQSITAIWSESGLTQAPNSSTTNILIQILTAKFKCLLN